jgi:hypothetical protein
MFYEHGSKSQPLCSCLINLFPSSVCPCGPHHPLTAPARMVQSYRRPTNWVLCSRGAFTSRLLPAFPTGWAATSFGRRSSPDQIKHMAATQSAAPHFGLQVTQYLNRCSGNRWIGRGGPHACPPRSQDFNTPWFLNVGKREGLGVSGEIADTRWTLTAHRGRCCLHTEVMKAYWTQHALF